MNKMCAHIFDYFDWMRCISVLGLHMMWGNLVLPVRAADCCFISQPKHYDSTSTAKTKKRKKEKLFSQSGGTHTLPEQICNSKNCKIYKHLFLFHNSSLIPGFFSLHSHLLYIMFLHLSIKLFLAYTPAHPLRMKYSTIACTAQYILYNTPYTGMIHDKLPSYLRVIVA